MVEKRYEEEREKLDPQGSPSHQPWRKIDVLGAPYEVDVVTHYQRKLCSCQDEERVGGAGAIDGGEYIESHLL